MAAAAIVRGLFAAWVVLSTSGLAHSSSSTPATILESHAYLCGSQVAPISPLNFGQFDPRQFVGLAPAFTNECAELTAAPDECEEPESTARCGLSGLVVGDAWGISASFQGLLRHPTETDPGPLYLLCGRLTC